MTSVSEAFLSKEVSHPLGNINVHPHLIHLSFAQLFFSYLYLMVPHYHTMLQQYTLPPFFYHYLKWKYKKRENGNIWAKRNKCFTASINPHHFIFLQCTLLYRVSPFHMYYCHVPQNQIVLVTIERTTVLQRSRGLLPVLCAFTSFPDIFLCLRACARV